MLKGYKHSISCKCGESILYFDEYDTMEKELNKKKKSECCNSAYEYVGLRPYYENILNISNLGESSPTTSYEDVEETVDTRPDNKSIPTQEFNHIVVEEKPVISPTVPTSNPTEKINVDDIIQPGPKGVSNKQMIPALKELIEKGESEKLQVLKEIFPEVFEGSIKYIGKKYQDKLNELI